MKNRWYGEINRLKTGYIDIHSHILPGVDDGAENVQMSMEMLRTAYADGIGKIIATPHFHYRRGHATPDEVRTLVQKMQQELDAAGMELTLYPGNELYYTHELPETVKAGEALTLADSDYVLLEFSPDTEKRKIHNAVYSFLSEGYNPIIAHMERYEAFSRHPEFAEEIRQMGAYFQMNAGSFLGNAGFMTKRFSKKMLDYGMISFLASDAHDLKNRAPVLLDAVKKIEKKYGAEDAEDYFLNNPSQIIENKMI